jgi:hypothetical protein
VRYPVPGGLSQLASLKLIMTTYSKIVCMASKAVMHRLGKEGLGAATTVSPEALVPR